MTYVVQVSSDLYGNDEHEYDSMEEAEEGLLRLVRSGLERGDDVERWYNIISREDDHDQD